MWEALYRLIMLEYTKENCKKKITGVIEKILPLRIHEGELQGCYKIKIGKATNKEER